MTPSTARRRPFSRFLLAASLACVLAGCSLIDDDSDAPLPGERLSVLELQKRIEPDDPAKAAPLVLPSPWNNEFWPQAGGYPNHVMQHLALNGDELKKAWSARIGKGSSDSLPLTATPVVADGRVYTIDAAQTLSAFDAASGAQVWKTAIKDPGEDDLVIGGGIAFADGFLYVTNGYDELLTVNAADGKIVRRTHIAAPARAAPSVQNGRVFVTTLDNRLLALNAADGSLLWEYSGMGENAALVGAASPAVDGETVVPAFSSGEIFALRIENGAVGWGENLSALRRTTGIAGLSAIRGLPVIDRNLVIAISFGGRLTALDARTGDRVWQRDISGSETPWVAGTHVFVISSDGGMAAIERDTGFVRWVTQLPRYENEEAKKNPISWAGPVLAGGRLFAAGTSGRIAEFSPEDGKLIREWSAGKSVHMAPVVAGGTLYLLSEDGTLTAYR